MEENEKNQGKLTIELNDEVAEGVYSNLAIISHSSSDFVIDFIRIMPNTNKAKVKSRVILTPEHARKLLAALEDNIAKYESQFGKISRNDSGYNPPLINFGNSGEA